MVQTSMFVRPPTFLSGATFIHEESAPFLYHLHKHDLFSEMLIVEEGEGEFIVDGKTFRAGKGTLLFYQRGLWHQERSVKHPFRATYISFNGLELRGLPANYAIDPDEPPIIPLGDQYAVIRRLAMECIEAAESNEPECRQIANHLFGILFAKLIKVAYYDKGKESIGKPTLEAVLRARRYMEENYRKAIALDDLAGITFLNKFHLAHLFREKLGLSPIQFLIQYRMEVARHYLLTTEYPVGQIAEWVGYESGPSFYGAFKKVVGMTPREYRDRGTIS